MKFYIASKDQVAAQGFRDDLIRAGHTVISSWVDEQAYGTTKKRTDAEKAGIAGVDLDEVRRCDALIHRSEPDGSYVPGGKHCECGGALILGKPVFLIGKPENIFHYHKNVMRFPTWEAFIEYLKFNWRSYGQG